MSGLRRATRDDNAALIELFGRVPMRGDLVLSTRREPDFFALYDLQRGATECWLYEDDGVPAGMATLLVREGWLDGRAQRVGYLGDLRAQAKASHAKALARFYGPVFDQLCEEHQCEHYLTTVLASNQAAINALARRRSGRVRQPFYQPLTRFAAASIQFTRPRRPRAGDLSVRVATAEDLPAIVALLDADHRARPFGYRFDQDELAHRLAHWPGFALGHTYVAYDRSGRLRACTTAWDPSAVKRYRVLAYQGPMRWARLGYDALATLARRPRLPAPGKEFRYFYLCNTSVLDDDPASLAALLDRVYADFYPAGYHFFTLYMDERDPLAPALRGFTTRALDFQMYAVTRSEIARSEYPSGRTGFEIALA